MPHADLITFDGGGLVAVTFCGVARRWSPWVVNPVAVCFSTEDRVVLDDAFEECCYLSDGVLVVAGLRAEDCCLQCAKVADSVGTSELVDYEGVNREDFDDSSGASGQPGAVVSA